MTYILVINAGSSSLKYQLIDIDSESVVAKGNCERIGIEDSFIGYKPTGKEPVKRMVPIGNHEDAIRLVLDILVDKDIGVVPDMSCIKAVGHRVLHGGEKFSAPALINNEVLAAIEECIPLGPLHNPANLMGIRGCMAAMDHVPMVAVFDTAWGQTIEPHAFMYALPYEAYETYRIRRYGFHGTSHRYVAGRAISLLGGEAAGTRVVTCHLGNGSSLSAVKDGKCIDTSMGFTPLEGVPMGTRCGSIDPAIIPFLMERAGISAREIDDYMNKQSGVWGISGLSNDFRDLESAANEGHKRAQLARDIFTYHVKKYIGAYAAALGGLDAIVFTAGVGENDADVREKCLRGLEYLGVDMDFEYNSACPRGVELTLTKPESKVKVFLIPTDEEMTIARDTAALAL